MSGAMDRLSALDDVEKNIITCLTSAGLALQELSKDKSSMKQMDQHTNHFLKTLNHVELEMGKHINYLTQVSTGQAHEGSSYASQKVLQMAWHRSEHARSKVIELERMKGQFAGGGAGAMTRPFPGAGRPGTPAGSSAASTPSTPFPPPIGSSSGQNQP